MKALPILNILFLFASALVAAALTAWANPETTLFARQ